MQDVISRKFGLKVLKNNFLKISLHFLVEDAKPFSSNMQSIILLSIMKQFFLLALQTDGLTYTFLKSRHTDSNCI